MSIAKKLLGVNPSGGDKQNVEDVFSTYLYEGNESTQTITNGIDLAGEGGLVWIKRRNSAERHALFDNERGLNSVLATDEASGARTRSGWMSSFNANGFTLNTGDTEVNNNGDDYVSWTFRKAPKFFDVVTYTGNGVAGREIAHDLGCDVGFILIKNVTSGYNWNAWSRGDPTKSGKIHSNSSFSTSSILDSFGDGSTAIPPTDTVFTVASGGPVNSSGQEYVAYIWAHDPDGDDDDGMIACGSYTGNGSTDGPEIDLGWEPQYILIKSSSHTNEWQVFDSMRGAVTGGTDKVLHPNTNDAEYSQDVLEFNSTGFQPKNNYSNTNSNNYTYIYMAIRGPMMKEPEDATDVFAVNTRVNTDPNHDAGFAPDFVIANGGVSGSDSTLFISRLTNGEYLKTDVTNAAVSAGDYAAWDYSNGWRKDGSTSTDALGWLFKRAKGYCDVVAYTGTGSAQNITHSLGAVPELMIVKRRDGATNWQVYSVGAGNTMGGSLNLDDAWATSSAFWNNTTPTDEVFTVGTGSTVNASGGDYMAWLFGTVEGVSYAGYYTGNGVSGRVVDCGFSTGARFVLIRRITDYVPWWLLDTERGIVANANDPYIQLHTNIAQITNVNLIDPHASGFSIGADGGDANVNNQAYMVLAIA